MVYRWFTVQLVGRVLLLLLAMVVVTWLLLQPGLHSLALLASVFFVLALLELWRYVSRTNRDLARFFAAARHADYAQKFSLEKTGGGFESLRMAFNDILERLRAEQMEKEAGFRRLRALIEHIPVPLLTVHDDQLITLQNNAARRLFGAEHVVRLRDLEQFGEGFHKAVAQAVPGVRELVTFSVEDVEYCLTLATTEIISGGKSERLVSLQDIQTELDQSQAQAWQDLVRVLTHEIMNSITPVTSLAATSKEVVDDLLEKTAPGDAAIEDLEDLQVAITTLAHRSDGLMKFVTSYRQISRLAPPQKQRVVVAELFETATRLAESEWPDNSVLLVRDVAPAGLDVHVDRDLLEPVLLNLLRNAWQATTDTPDPQVKLTGRLNRRGRTVIEVRDNGHGVPDELARKIFVPFFTTKEVGSGVGLALARQVMIAHGGFIRVARNEDGGATFTLTF